MSYMFVGHDLSVAEFFCDEILVMHRGQMQEFGPSEQVFGSPRSDYTRSLISAMPRQL